MTYWIARRVRNGRIRYAVHEGPRVHVVPAIGL
jgi:hypothetical protein